MERDLGNMQMEALDLRGTARAREAEAAALRDRVAEQAQQVSHLNTLRMTLASLSVRACTVDFLTRSSFPCAWNLWSSLL